MRQDSNEQPGRRKWSQALIDDIVFKIRDNSIVPIVGPGVYYVEDGGRRIGVLQFIVGELLRRNLPQLAGTADTDVYTRGGFKGMTRLNRLFETHEIDLKTSLRSIFYDPAALRRIRMNEQVRLFLDRGEFPLVLTTCYFRVLDTLIDRDGARYQVVAYQKEQTRQQDIPLADDTDTLSSPTVFHLFGLLRSSDKNYVVTENDFLSFLHCIQDTNHYPRRLKHYLEDRYLLTLGCEIPDWTFRFLLYSLKGKNGELGRAAGAVNNFAGGAVTRTIDEDLDEFLSDIKYFSNNRVDDFLADINRQLQPADRPSVFLSMRHEEYDGLGSAVKSQLGSQFKVWFFADRNDPQYWKSIEQGIGECRYFMPVVTKDTLFALIMGDDEQSDDINRKGRGLVTEWRKALERKQQLGDRLFCLPYLVDVGTADMKKFLKQHHEDLWPLFFPAEGIQCISGPVERLMDDPVIKTLLMKHDHE